MIKDFQPQLRAAVPTLKHWPERLADVGGIGTRAVEYGLGYPKVEDTQVLLYHDDVLALTIELMKLPKFRTLFVERFPILLIDEYQDTDASFIDAMKVHFLDSGSGPLLGLFGDHWQKIYGDGCGKVDHSRLVSIGKSANFRSVPAVVEVLNRMRPELPQAVTNPDAQGSVAVYHTNLWAGARRTGQHWAGDLPPEESHRCLDLLMSRLRTEGWDFSPEKTKILMLTHKVLAKEQGYNNLANVFPFNDMYIKKDDAHIAFFVDTLEPICSAFEKGQYGEMFAVLGGSPAIHSHADKVEWTESMNALLALRATGSIGAVLDHLRRAKRPQLPDAVERKERELERMTADTPADEVTVVERLRSLREVSYREVCALDKFIDGHTPFATKHGVKGAEFENVIVVLGRGWNHYDFNQMLEWAAAPSTIPADKQETFERNRNLFYVVCSRPKTRLALLFTQRLSSAALRTLERWFGSGAIHAAPLS